MVEINISVKANGDTQVQDLLEHIVKEIADEDYRLSEISRSMRHVDLNWVHMDEGKYQWSRNDRT